MIKEKILLFLSGLIDQISKIGGVDSHRELIVLLVLTIVLSVLPGPAILIPIVYGRVKTFGKKILSKVKRKKEC